MVYNLEKLGQELNKPLTTDRLHSIIRKTEEFMRKDTEDWLLLFASKELEKTV